jgi:hypothetical protein
MGLPMGWKHLTDKVTQLLTLLFFIMSAKLIALAAELVDTNPAGAQLIVDITNAETGDEILEALDAYDAAVIDSVSEVVAV